MDEAVFGKDEQRLDSVQWKGSLLNPTPTASFTLTNKRVIGTAKRTLFGIPIGNQEVTQPLRSISSVQVSSQIKVIRILIGALIAVIGLAFMGDFPGRGVILLILGLLLVVSALKGGFVIADHGGSTQEVEVALNARDTARRFASRVNQAVADLP